MPYLSNCESCRSTFRYDQRNSNAVDGIAVVGDSGGGDGAVDNVNHDNVANDDNDSMPIVESGIKIDDLVAWTKKYKHRHNHGVLKRVIMRRQQPRPMHNTTIHFCCPVWD